MPFKAGFASVDITPPKGTNKIGWLKKLTCRTVLDPIYAHVAVFDNGRTSVAFVSLDTLSVRWTMTDAIRKAVAKRTGIPAANIMVAATHNHAGPAVATAGESTRDDRYCATLIRKVTEALVKAWKSRTPALIALGSGFETTTAHNRRIVLRDGTTCTHGHFLMPEALYVEGPMDPEVGVIAVKSSKGKPLGLIVNFTNHPTHHGGTDEVSAGYPGCLAHEMAGQGWPTTLFLNGACGNIHHTMPATNTSNTKETCGAVLANAVAKVLEQCRFSSRVSLCSRSATIHLPFRAFDPDEARGKIRGTQRFVLPAIYDRTLVPKLIKRMKRMPDQPAEVQVLSINNSDLVSIPAEYFCELGLKIKELAYPRHALVVGYANGMVGYVPHREAFLRGGYETTLGEISRLAPEAGDMLADTAIHLIKAKTNRKTP